MKYIVIVGDGMSDRPLPELNDHTPLEIAKIPNLNFLAKNGAVGQAYTIPKGMEAGSDVANLSILGYNPAKYYCGRGSVEAANLGIKLGDSDVAFRCNLITAGEDILIDYSAGHISTKEAEVLIKFVDKKIGTETIKFYPGISYRHIVVFKSNVDFQAADLMKVKCTPPHNITGKSVSQNLPKGKHKDILIKLMESSRHVLEQHEINKVRIDLGENPANMIWLWGQGQAPSMPSFMDEFGITGSVISAVDLIKGLGRIIGLDSINVPGATGYYDTDYAAKGRYAVNSLLDKDFVFVHVEAPDEAGHNGDLRAKIGAIENLDKFVVGPALEYAKSKKDVRILVMPDHATPISIKTHASDPVPFVIYGSNVKKQEISVFSEKASATSKLIFEEGFKLLKYFIKEREI